MSESIKITPESPTAMVREKEPSLFAAHYGEVKSLIARLEALHAQGGFDSETESEAVLSELSRIACAVAVKTSSTYADVQLKALLYQALAPEYGSDFDDLSVDERLAHSLVADIQRIDG